MRSWPRAGEELIAAQRVLADLRPPPWKPGPNPVVVAGCFAAMPKGLTGPGSAGDMIWAGASAFHGKRLAGRATVQASAGWPYQPGLLALRVGPALEDVVRALPALPDVLLVDATGRDHPRRAGLALHLGAILDVPTVGVTHRTLLATGGWPADERSATSPLLVNGEIVGKWVRSRAGRRPVAVHAAWRTTADVAAEVVLTCGRHRTPRPLREARRLARTARAASQ